MIILALGSNLPSTNGDRFYNIDQAVSYLEHYGIQILKKSSYYETDSFPNKKDPKFINIVISAKTILPPEDLASVLIFSTRSFTKSVSLVGEEKTDNSLYLILFALREFSTNCFIWYLASICNCGGISSLYNSNKSSAII